MDEVVVVTGASAGVGRATAAAFGHRGASVGLLARGQAGLEGARRDVERQGGRAITVPTDVADPDQVEAGAEAVEEAFGPIDIWVNDAMTTVLAEFTELTAEEFRRVTEVTYLGSVYGAMAALRRMRPRNHGSIVQVGSALGYRGIPLQSAYCGAKHGLVGFYESLRTELRHNDSDVWLSMVDLPAVNTPQFSHGRTRLPNHPQPMPPIYQPEVCADAVVWAATHRRRQLWVGYSTAMTIMANRLSPGLVERYLARNAYGAQQTDQPVARDRPDNLFAPTDTDRDEGAHGIFDSRARANSPLLRLSSKRRAIGLVGTAAATLAFTTLVRRKLTA